MSTTTTIDWSFLDAVYLITCPNADPNGERLQTTKSLLEQVGLLDRVEVKEFDTDDEDRIRGCYTSHISVLRDANSNNKKNPLNTILKSLWQDDDETPNNKRILVLEDNVALANTMSQDVIDSISQFSMTEDWDIIHLSYIPYVPDLTISKTSQDQIVRLTTGGLGSAIGTTAYIINTQAVNRLIEEDDKNGFFAPIPDVMAKLFPDSRFAANPIVFVRAPNTKSLVNPQLDDLRQLLFQPAVASFAQMLLIQTGFSTNVLLQLVVAALLLTTIASATLTVQAISSVLTTGSFDGPIIVPIISSAFTLLALGIILQGALLAPKPPVDADDVEGSQ